MKENCPFCNNDREKLVRNLANVRVIFSDPRLAEGHLLVMPKRHIESTWELNEKEIKEIFDCLKDFSKQLSEKIGTGCDIKQNYRPFIKQNNLKVDHLHFHLVPRTFQDEIYQKSGKFVSEIFKDLTDKEYSKVMKLLKKNDA